MLISVFISFLDCSSIESTLSVINVIESTALTVISVFKSTALIVVSVIESTDINVFRSAH